MASDDRMRGRKAAEVQSVLAEVRAEVRAEALALRQRYTWNRVLLAKKPQEKNDVCHDGTGRSADACGMYGMSTDGAVCAGGDAPRHRICYLRGGKTKITAPGLVGKAETHQCSFLQWVVLLEEDKSAAFVW